METLLGSQSLKGIETMHYIPTKAASIVVAVTALCAATPTMADAQPIPNRRGTTTIKFVGIAALGTLLAAVACFGTLAAPATFIWDPSQASACPANQSLHERRTPRGNDMLAVRLISVSQAVRMQIT